MNVRTKTAPEKRKSSRAPAESARTVSLQPEPSQPTPRWKNHYSYLVLTVLTLVCLLPFSGKAVHVDDTLFVWAAQHIVQHPLDPYGFNVVWYSTAMPMSEVTKNPPLASYYIAAIASVAGWSERTLHLAFLFPALIVILGTYYLAQRFTRNPLLAAAATLLTPCFLISSTSMMCDTSMVAAWILAVIFWLEGLDRNKPALLACAGVLIAVSALAKYFGMALMPLLLVYTLFRQRRISVSILYLLIPVLMLAEYQHWTHTLYGKGLLSQAAEYSSGQHVEWTARLLTGLSFVGGCALTATAFSPLLWSWRRISWGVTLAGLAGFSYAMGWIATPALALADDRNWVGVQFALFLTGGIAVGALVFSDWRKRKDADSLLLGLWVLGTFVFAVFVNWTVNARSVLPLIPAVGILLARRVDPMKPLLGRDRWKLIAPLAAAGIVSLWITSADARLANSAREAAQFVRDHSSVDRSTVSFQGHWGFQYYMQAFGFQPFDVNSQTVRNGDLVVIPKNNTNTTPVFPQVIASSQTLQIDVNRGASTMSPSLGAGFYFDGWGPLPYAFGSVPPESYTLIKVKDPRH